VQATIDPIAERVRMIGQDPIATPVEVMEVASVKPARLGQTMREMAEEANAHVVRVIREMREAAEAADDAKDPGTVDLFSRFVQIHEKHEWFLRDLLERGDALVS
jgi:starvation-inducible DNA-binding protein